MVEGIPDLPLLGFHLFGFATNFFDEVIHDLGNSGQLVGHEKTAILQLLSPMQVMAINFILPLHHVEHERRFDAYPIPGLRKLRRHQIGIVLHRGHHIGHQLIRLNKLAVPAHVPTMAAGACPLVHLIDEVVKIAVLRGSVPCLRHLAEAARQLTEHFGKFLYPLGRQISDFLGIFLLVLSIGCSTRNESGQRLRDRSGSEQQQNGCRYRRPCRGHRIGCSCSEQSEYRCAEQQAEH